MPKAFLVRKLRQQWKAAACGLVTPPPSPEQTTISASSKQEETQHHPSFSGKIFFLNKLNFFFKFQVLLFSTLT